MNWQNAKRLEVYAEIWQWQFKVFPLLPVGRWRERAFVVQLVVLAIFGALGAVARYAVSGWVVPRAVVSLFQSVPCRLI